MNTVATLLSAQALTASGSEAAGHDFFYSDSVSVQIIVSAATGTTPSATFSLLWSNDNVTFSPASPADAFAAITAAGSVVQRFATKGQFYKLAWVVTGTTPSLTTTARAYS
jgi:hypothetical protein